MAVEIIDLLQLAYEQKRRKVVFNTPRLHAWVHYYPNPGESALIIANVDGSNPRQLMASTGNAVPFRDYLLFRRGEQLVVDRSRSQSLRGRPDSLFRVGSARWALRHGRVVDVQARDASRSVANGSQRRTPGEQPLRRVAEHFLGAPFGGWKQSGIGREECFEELMAFTQEKNVHVRLKPAAK